jgi:hypothetical protein
MNKKLLFITILGLLVTTVRGGGEGGNEASAARPTEANGFEAQENVAFTFTGQSASFVATAAHVVVDWGDGSTTAWHQPLRKREVAHRCEEDAEYTVRIRTLSLFGCTGGDANGHGTITALDVSRCPTLMWLFCYDNRLGTPDVSANRALTMLDCGGNRLSRLDVSNSTALTELLCSDNQLSVVAPDAVFKDLPGQRANKGVMRIVVGDNPGSGLCDRSIAAVKNWDVKDQ